MKDAIAINNEITVATLQVTPEQLHQAVQAGFHSVLNLRSPDEPGFLNDEHTQAEAAGLHYENTPVKPMLLDDGLVAQILQQIERLPKPALLHCGSGLRAGLMASLYVAMQQGWTADRTVAMAQTLGLKWPAQPALKQVCERACQC